jgi:hypothetical protein
MRPQLSTLGGDVLKTVLVKRIYDRALMFGSTTTLSEPASVRRSPPRCAHVAAVGPES